MNGERIRRGEDHRRPAPSASSASFDYAAYDIEVPPCARLQGIDTSNAVVMTSSTSCEATARRVSPRQALTPVDLRLMGDRRAAGLYPGFDEGIGYLSASTKPAGAGRIALRNRRAARAHTRAATIETLGGAR